MKRNILMLLLAMSVFGSKVEGRTWRPKGGTPIKGDFVDVSGDTVRVQTSNGIEEFRYQELSATDQAVVKSSLQLRGLSDEASRLNRQGRGTNNKGVGGSDDPTKPGEMTESTRTWRDISGNELQGEFVGVQGSEVLIRVKGAVKTNPILGFSTDDQAWISEYKGEESQRASGDGQTSGVQPGLQGYPDMCHQTGSSPPREVIQEQCHPRISRQ